MICDLWCIEDVEKKGDLMGELMNYRGDCRTTPATPGVLNISTKYK